MEKSLSLCEASVQEIQLELLRRTQFNAMDGSRVVDGLRRHRDLWEAALLDRPGLVDYTRPRRLLTMGLLKLRDLAENYWNADTLFVLTPSPESATTLMQVAEREEWGGMARTIEDCDEIERAVCTDGDKKGLLVIWWD